MIFFLLALLAVLPAWHDRKLAALAFCYALVVGFSLLVLPAYVGTGITRYLATASLELVVVLVCVLIRHPAGIAVAILSMLNIEWNWLASTDYAAGIKGLYWSSYKTTILMSQWGQIAALWLFSPPFVTAIERLFGIQADKDGKKWMARTAKTS